MKDFIIVSLVIIFDNGPWAVAGATVVLCILVTAPFVVFRSR